MEIKRTAIAIGICLFPAAVNAQVSVEMANIRCEQYLAMSPVQSRDFSAWMSGWYSFKVGKTWVDLVAHQKNISNVQSWCKYHLSEPVMSGLDKAVEGK